MSVQEKQAVLMGEMQHPDGDRVAVVRFHDGLITLFALPEDVSLENFAGITDTRPAGYEDLVAFNRAITCALAGAGEQCIDLTPDTLQALYNFAVNTAQDLEAKRYDNQS